MKNRLCIATLLSAFASTFASGIAYADDEPNTPATDRALAFNAALNSDYRFRGVSQSRLNPAVSAGADYTAGDSGIYVGTWASSIKWISDAGGSGNAELDVYGGKRGNLGGSFSYDLGVLRYIYPSNDLTVNADTTELYGQIGYGSTYLKYSHAVTDLFGFEDSKGSGYWDAGTSIDLVKGYALNLHLGHQLVKNHATAGYTDWKIGVSKDFGIFNASLALVGTDNDDAYRTNGHNLAGTGVVFGIAKTF